MKLLKFYLKYFPFRSLRNVKNIEAVIKSHGFAIYTFCLESKEDAITELIKLLDAYDHAKSHDSFIATNRIIKGVFIKDGLSDDDRRELLFHEEAHIWYGHQYNTNHTDQTERQQERVANQFLSRLKVLKAITNLVAMLLLMIWALVPALTPKSDILDSPATETQRIEQTQSQSKETIETENIVYITGTGEAYHRKTCPHITGSSTTTAISQETAQTLGKISCKSCMP